MATGFIQRFKGKIATFWGGIWQNGVQSSAVFHNAGAPSNGTSGTLAGIAGPGAILVDTTNKAAYQNTNTLASPTWTTLSAASGNITLATLTLTALLKESVTDSIVAGATQTQAGATGLTTEVNRVATNAAPGNGVKLMASGAGLTIVVINATANAMQVYGTGADTINGQTNTVGVSQMANSAVLYICTTAGVWVTEGLGTGFAGSNQTFSFADALSANSGGVQAGATPITTALARFTTVAGANYSALLPASAPGLEITVANAGANMMTIWPNGSSDTINGNNNASSIPYYLAPGGVVSFISTVAGAWHSLAGAAFPASIAAGLTSATSIANQQTPTTGGVTLKNQTLVANAVWRVRAFGTYVAANSATARNAEFSCFWGATQLTKVVSVILASTAQTTDWEVEFLITASSTTAAWVVSKLLEQTDVVLTTTAADLDMILGTPTSNTGLSTGPQTLDLRFDTSASVAGDSFSVQSVVMERLL